MQHDVFQVLLPNRYAGINSPKQIKGVKGALAIFSPEPADSVAHLFCQSRTGLDHRKSQFISNPPYQLVLNRLDIINIIDKRCDYKGFYSWNC